MRNTSCFRMLSAFERIRRRATGLLVALLVMVGIFAPAVTAANVGALDDVPPITINDGNTTTVIHFAGHEWYAIGYDGNGVYSAAGDNSVTLLAKNEDFGTEYYRQTSYTDPDDDSYIFSGNAWYKHFGEGSFEKPADYLGSNIQHRMETIAEEFRIASWREYDMIRARTLISDNERFCMTGADVVDQKLWVLDYPEWVAINRDVVILKFQEHWWARGTSPYDDIAAMVGHKDGNQAHVYVVGSIYLVRPVLSLNLENVLLTTDATGTDTKSSVAVGSGLAPMQQLDGGNIKFTMLDETMAAPSVTLTDEGSNTLQFTFTGAETGVNQYLSCTVEQNGAIKYYAKLEDCSSSGSGTFAINVGSDANGAPLDDGTYLLKIFSEQANGDDYSDFASSPQIVPFTVEAGSGEVNSSLVITTQPADATYLEGEAAVALFVETETYGTVSYQWYYNEQDSNTGGIAIDDATGDTYTPPITMPGTTHYYVEATNVIAGKTGVTASDTATIVVNERVDAQTPTINAQPQAISTFYLNEAATDLTVQASVTDGGSLSFQWYSAENANGANPLLIPGAESAVFTPSTDTKGSFYYFAEVKNENTGATGSTTASTNSNVATVHVLDKLVLDVPDTSALTAIVGQPYSLVPGYTYLGNDVLEFSLDTTLPDGLSFVPATGEISGTPAEGTEGSHPLTLTVSEENGTATASIQFTLVIQSGPPQPAVILSLVQPGSDTVTENTSYTKQLAAQYTGADMLEYSAAGLPKGISINTATGLISGKPEKAGIYKVNVTVKEQNGDLTDTSEFTITVVEGPVTEKPALSVSGLPTGTIRVGDTFTLTPSDDGQTGSNGWSYDKEFFSATFNSPATFKALKAGTSVITYTATDGRVTSVTVTIQAAVDSSSTTSATSSTSSSSGGAIAETGDGNSVVWYFVLATTAMLALAGIVLYRKRRAQKG